MEFSHEIALALVQSDNPFPVNFDDAVQWIGYSTKQKAKNKLLNNFGTGIDYMISLNQSVERTGRGGQNREDIRLTVDCFKSLGMMAGTQKGKEVRRYFLECERVAKAATKIIPAQDERIRQLELELALSEAQAETYRQQRLLGQFNQAVLELHGAPTLALLQGRPEAVVERFTEVQKTVMCTETGTPLARFEGISKTAMAKRYGMQNAKQFVAWLCSMGKEDLLVQGLTAVPCEYLPREHVLELDHLWVKQQGLRQILIGERA